MTEDKLDCPNCKENKSFKFQPIKNKMVRSLLASMKVPHKCTQEQAEPTIYQYEELKKHIVTNCKAFQYNCTLCEQREDVKYAEKQINDEIEKLR